jgi:aminoglycoside phosphotransferase (APT) family kinase protein
VLGIRPGSLAPLRGASGRSWNAGEHILRVGVAAALDVEVAAWAAAANAVATPEPVDRVDLDTLSAVLVRRLPGTPAGRLDEVTSKRAQEIGQACGRLHTALAAVPAPHSLPRATAKAARPGRAAPPPGDRLLHLDLHPFNVLIDARGDVSGVLDWANAAAGHPDLDRARSLSILTLDPAAVERSVDPRWAALVRGWIDAGNLDKLTPDPTAWACRFMLDDLANRYDQQQLAVVAATLERADRSL